MRTDKRLSSVSFFCPAYREEVGLPILVRKMHLLLGEIAEVFEIIIIEDGSPDSTGSIADHLAAEFTEVRVIHHPKNMGYGPTIRDGFMSSRYEYVIYTDSDNQYDVFELKKALPLLAHADVVSGYAIGKKGSFGRKIQSFIFNLLVRSLFFVPYRDMNCAMKIYKRAVLDTIAIAGKSACVGTETLLRAHRAGYRIVQFPVTHFARQEGEATGSKPRVILLAIADILRLRFSL